MERRAVDADCNVLARAAAGFPSGAASSLVAPVWGSHYVLLTDATDYIITAALTTGDAVTAGAGAGAATAAGAAAAARLIDKNVVQESAKPHDNSKRDKGASRQAGGPMSGIIGLLPF